MYNDNKSSDFYPSFSSLINLLDCIIDHYAYGRKEADGSNMVETFLRSYKRDSIVSGFTYFVLKYSNIELEEVDEVYDTTLYRKKVNMGDTTLAGDDSNKIYAEIVTYDKDKWHGDCKFVVTAPTKSRIVIAIPVPYLIVDNNSTKNEIYNLYKSITMMLDNLYGFFNKGSLTRDSITSMIHEMRRAIVTYGFINAKYAEDPIKILDTLNAIDNKKTLERIPSYALSKYISEKAVIEMIKNDLDVSWNDHNISTNIEIILNKFDSGDMNFWMDLTLLRKQYDEEYSKKKRSVKSRSKK